MTTVDGTGGMKQTFVVMVTSNNLPNTAILCQSVSQTVRQLVSQSASELRSIFCFPSMLASPGLYGEEATP